MAIQKRMLIIIHSIHADLLKPTVNPTTTPFANNKIKISGNPIIEIPKIQINPMYFNCEK